MRNRDTVLFYLHFIIISSSTDDDENSFNHSVDFSVGMWFFQKGKKSFKSMKRNISDREE